MDAKDKERWSRLGLEAGGLAVVSTLIWVLSWVFLDEAFSQIVAIILLVGGMMVGVMNRRDFPTKNPTLLKWAVSLGFVIAAVWVASPPWPEAEVDWQPYSEAAIRNAAVEGKPVVIDFYADWCPPCRKLDSRVFTRKKVVDALDRFVKLRADLSDQNSPANVAISERHGVEALPTVVFIASDGVERDSLRLLGYEPASKFLGRLRAVK